MTTTPDAAPERYVRLVELLTRCAQHQPTLSLLDDDGAITWDEVEGGRAVVTLAGHPGVLDPETERFVPDDPEPVRLLLVERLRATHGDAEFPAEPRSVAVDWDTVGIIEERDGELHALALTVATGLPLMLTVSAGWELRVEFAVPPPTAVEAAAEVLTDAVEDLASAGLAPALISVARRHPAGEPGRRSLAEEAVRVALASLTEDVPA